MRIPLPLACAALMVAACAQARAVQLKQMPIDFVGEWCNGTASGDQTNWMLPSWVEEGGKCTNILSVTKYDFSLQINGRALSCSPDVIRQDHDTALSGTTYLATISAHCNNREGIQGRGTPATFEFSRYKGNIYIKQK